MSAPNMKKALKAVMPAGLLSFTVSRCRDVASVRRTPAQAGSGAPTLPPARNFERLLGGNLILALNQAARIVPRHDVPEPHIALEGAEERNPVSNEHGHASDNETLNEARTQEALNGDPAIDVGMVGTTSSKLRHDLSRGPGHLFNNASANGGQVDGATTQHDYALVT